MKITKQALGNLILEELQRLDEKPKPAAKRQKRREDKAKRRKARQAGQQAKKAGQKAKEAGRAAKEAAKQTKAAAKPASPKQQDKPQQKTKKSEFAGLSPEEQSAALEKKLFGDEPKKEKQKSKLSPEEQEARFQKLAFGDEPEKEKSPQAAAKDAAQQAKKTEKATTKAGLQKATGEKVDTGDQPEEIQKVSNEIEKLRKKLQSWATKTASKIPAEDKKARLAVMKIPMALKIANQSIDKISKQDNESLQAVLDGEKPPAQGGEAEEPAANRREVEEAVIYDLEELLKNEM